MHLETMARDIILTDRSLLLSLRRHLDKKETSISRPVREMWKLQSGVVTIEEVKKAVEIGTVTDSWKEAWERETREMIRDSMSPAWTQSIKASGDDVAVKVNGIQKKQFDFDSTMTSVKGWVDNKGGILITDLTAAQIGSVHALLQDQIALGVTSPQILAARIRPIVGLTERQAGALIRRLAALVEEGLAPNVINRAIEKTAQFYHKSRASMIARTELSNGYNFGHLDSLRQASAEGWLPGRPEKNWIAGGQNPCNDCLTNEAAGFISLEASFPSGPLHPTAHPLCECSLGSKVRR